MGKKSTNEGKAFELDVKQSCINDGLFYLRLNDTSIPFQNGGARFAAENPCDCLVFDKPNLFAIECKSTKYKSISFDREEGDKNMIKLHQINSLIKFSETEGIFAGFLLNFRNEEIRSEGMTYWMDIRDFSNFYTSTDKSSINRLDVV